MQRLLFTFFLAILLLLCFSQERKNNNTSLKPDYISAERIFQQAQHQSDKAGDDTTLQADADILYTQANIAFLSLIPVADKENNDSLGFLIRLRTAFIASYFDSINVAKKYYLEAITLKQHLPQIPDSLLFTPYVYMGGICYRQNQFDSALYYYKKAEQINDSYNKPLAEAQRLYNRLGAMYYETGNYRQARNYFEKAIAVLAASGSRDIGLLVNYKINTASLLIKLESYKEAQSVYESILAYHVFTDEINHNLGIISIKQQEYKKAIEYFRKVNYKDNNKIIDLCYNLGVAWAGLQEKDSSAFYLQQALAENIRWNSQRKNIPYGLILRFQADELVNQREYKKAVETYQQAIMQFDASFNETDIYKNPEIFSEVFSYINLFNTLAAKADAMKLLYQEEKDIKLLQASLETYRCAFSLADYVEKTYNSDEARLFLNKIKYTVHSKPIDISLELYDLTQKREYLEKAYTFDQQNKASILALNVHESELRRSSSLNKNLLEEETSVKTSITRLLLKLSGTSDSQQLQSIHSSIRDYEIRLGKLQEKLRADPDYRKRYFITQIPPVAELQKNLDEKTAILSYHLTGDELVVMLITGNLLSYYRSSVSPGFFRNTDSLKKLLQTESSDNRYGGTPIAQGMYKQLIAPLEPRLPHIRRLIIIPDDELNYLPFEALQDVKGNYLVEKFSIQYQYSTALWGTDDLKEGRKASGLLAFAPFASGGFTDSTGVRFSALPASKEETGSLKGNILTDSMAIKNNFLSMANHYGTIHLATHASVDNETPLRSFIAFYPAANIDADDYKLYAQEIYDMNLDSTQLIILSACETGTGKLIKGEGLMSLSRAFAYAGCPNIITSLWKAEDRTTAFITGRLHHYLEKGLPKDMALQQAKLDLLHSSEIDPRYKTPNYWAHLVFIGNYQAEHRRSNWWWIAIGIIIGAIIYRSLKQKNLPAKSRQA